MSYPPCSGIIVFDNDKTILVNTDRGNFSFPKGKRKKGETDSETAWREFYEETGIDKNDVELIDNVFIDEKSNKGNVNVRYFVGRIKREIKEFTYDKTELNNVQWICVDDALKLDKLKNKRCEVLQKAYAIHKTEKDIK